jgi:hypothetical protein
MFLSISKSGPKADVVEQIQAETQTVPLQHVETVIRKAIAQHLQEFAKESVPVSITASVSLNYAVELDTDGKEIPVTKVPEPYAEPQHEAMGVESSESVSRT